MNTRDTRIRDAAREVIAARQQGTPADLAEAIEHLERVVNGAER